jgi:hypothetical protein
LDEEEEEEFLQKDVIDGLLGEERERDVTIFFMIAFPPLAWLRVADALIEMSPPTNPNVFAVASTLIGHEILINRI